ncbi:TatD family hydrolase [Shewanella mesophila]|nr:TatD family hydrolase [Shewanella mesophila]
MPNDLLKVFDSHIHLDFDAFEPLRERLVGQMRKQGLVDAVIPGVSVEGWGKLIDIAKQYQCHYGLGIHPWYCNEDWQADVVSLEQYLAVNRRDLSLVAIGECGLDGFHRDNWQWQLPCFEAHLVLAQRYQLPVIIHSVKAHNEVLELLKRYPLENGGVIHGFYGGSELAKRYLNVGMKLGIGHLLLDEKAKKLPETIVNLPLTSFVIETDLALISSKKEVGIADEINGSSLILHLLIEKIANLQKKSCVLVSEQVFQNTLQLFEL